MIRRRSPAFWLGASGVLLVAAAMLGPRIVPLYDGVGFPDEPYRYAGRSDTAAPTDVQSSTPADSADKYLISVQSGESGPQVMLNIAAGAVTLPRSAPTLDLLIHPETPKSQPPTGRIAGNVYQVAASSTPGPPQIKNDNTNIYLRLPQGTPVSNSAPTMVYRPAGGQWRGLTTLQTGSDIYEARFGGVGEYALATGFNGSVAPTTARSRTNLLWPVALLSLVSIALIIVVIRTNSRRHPD